MQILQIPEFPDLLSLPFFLEGANYSSKNSNMTTDEGTLTNNTFLPLDRKCLDSRVFNKGTKAGHKLPNPSFRKKHLRLSIRCEVKPKCNHFWKNKWPSNEKSRHSCWQRYLIRKTHLFGLVALWPDSAKFKLIWQHFQGLISILCSFESTLASFECFWANDHCCE